MVNERPEMLEQSATLYFGPWYRRSPFFDATRRAGCSAYDIYNHMLLPGYYDDPEVEYRLLSERVVMWDVGVERTVQVSGPDADRLIDMITCRDLTTCAVKQGKYMIVTAPDGGIVNDPVLLHVDENVWWMQLADSDVHLYAMGVAASSGLDVEVSLPDVHPMQVQGPLSAKTLEKLVGPEIYDIKYYWIERFEIQGIPVVISRTGWTAVPGFEVNLLDGTRGDDLWNAVLAAGEEFGIRPAAPSEARPSGGGGPAPPAPAPSVSPVPPIDPGREPVAAVAERVLPAVVNVTTNVFQADPTGNPEEGKGVGTGFVVRENGVIVTNCHVVQGASRITVITSEEEPTRYNARVIGGDCEHDLAVLKVDADGLTTVPLGSSANLRLGQQVVAIGYALALEGGPSVTSGIVSSLDRSIRVPDPACSVCPQEQGVPVRTYSDVIQTDAAINHGNSGGPLVDMAGRVVGINSAGSDNAENIGFAIAIDSARSAIDQAIAQPLQATAYLGVTTRDVTSDLAFQLGLPTDAGAYVLATLANGPAADAGIHEGDVIVEVDGRSITAATTLGRVLDQLRPGQEVDVRVVGSGDQDRTVTVRLGTRPLPTEFLEP